MRHARDSWKASPATSLCALLIHKTLTFVVIYIQTFAFTPPIISKIFHSEYA